MFNLFPNARMLHFQRHRRSLPAHPVGAAFECLEWRGMLSNVPPFVSDSVEAAELQPMGHSTAVESLSWRATANPDVSILPVDRALAANFQDSEGISAIDWWFTEPPVEYPVPDSPPSQADSPPIPPTNSDDLSGSGGFIEFDNLGPVGPPEILLDSPADPDAVAVLEMLAALRYTPRSLRPESLRLGNRLESADGLQAASNLTMLQSRPRPNDQSLIQHIGDKLEIPKSGVAEQASRDLLEGGMVSILRDELVQVASTGDTRTVSQDTSLRSVPIEMDSTYGKFQAFEVSTDEDISAQVVPGTSDESPSWPISPDSQPATSEEMDLTPVSLRTQQSASEIDPQADGPAKQTPDILALPASPAATDSESRTSHYSVAAAIFLGYVASTASSFGNRQPNAIPTLFLRRIRKRPHPARRDGE